MIDNIPIPIPAPKGFHWLFERTFYGPTWRLIRNRDTTIQCEITEFNPGVFSVFKQGAGYGEYTELSPALRKAASVCHWWGWFMIL